MSIEIARILLKVTVFLAFPGTLLTITATGAEPPQSAGTQSESAAVSIQSLNQAAKRVREGDDSALTSLADQVLQTGGLEPELVDAFGFKDRLTRAERNFRAGKHKSIPETNVVKVVNHLSRKLNAPEYAFTNAYEVRKVRMGLMILYPQFVGAASTSSGFKQLPQRISDSMSPLEAYMVTSTLLYQKIWNDDFQQTREERNKSWADQHRRGIKKTLPLTSPRIDELLSNIRQVPTKMSMRDILAEADDSLTLLGIDK